MPRNTQPILYKWPRAVLQPALRSNCLFLDPGVTSQREGRQQILVLFNSSRVYMAAVKQSRNLHQGPRGLLNPDKALIPQSNIDSKFTLISAS